SDADLAIWDPTYEYVIEAAHHQSRADYSVYEGRKVTGAPVTVISRGEIVMSDREVNAQRGRGVWLEAQPPSRWHRS
ncbi:MAG: dihydropyrimidinase, partial [Acidimicrobiales bacterium]